MKNKLLTWGLKLIWTAAGDLSNELAAWITEAAGRGFAGREAFEYVWRKAKARYSTIGDWLLNLLIETAVGQAKLQAGGAALKWPAQL
jgi:hypothetical protein